MVREGEKVCDVNLAETQVRKSTVLGSSYHSERWFLLVAFSSRMDVFISLTKKKSSRKWHKEAEEKMQQELKWVGNCFKESEIHGEYRTTFAQRWADECNSAVGFEAWTWTWICWICFHHHLKNDGPVWTRRMSLEPNLKNPCFWFCFFNFSFHLQYLKLCISYNACLVEWSEGVILKLPVLLKTFTWYILVRRVRKHTL